MESRQARKEELNKKIWYLIDVRVRYGLSGQAEMQLLDYQQELEGIQEQEKRLANKD